MKRKVNKNVTAFCMAALLALTSTFPALAAGPVSLSASEKEEVVYTTLKSDGSLKDTCVVNSFTGGKITDYGEYSSVKMLNVNDPIEQKEDKITISSSAEKVYYQGNLKDIKIPWNISLHYYLDGKEYAPHEIAGKSGKLKIQIKITKNEDCSGMFFDDYALQASVSLDTKKCRNITAPDAIIANSGSSKQLSYTILPGKGMDTSITADVKDFEMNEISINGIHLNLNVDVEDKELKNKVNELINAVEELDHGALKLDDGSEKLLGASSGLKNGVSELHSGSAVLDKGVISLQNGLQTVQNGLNSLDNKSAELENGSSEFKNALKQIQTSVNAVSASGEDLTELAAASGKIKKAISDLNSGAAMLQQKLGYAQYKALMAENGLNIDVLKIGNAEAIAAIKQYKTLLETAGLLEEADRIVGLLSANNAAFGGMESYLDGVSSELPALTNGLSELKTQYEAFDMAIGKLQAGLGNMIGNLSALADGINQLAFNYEKLDLGIKGYTDGVAQIVSGYSQVINGVSSLAKGSKELVSGSEKLYGGTVKLYDGVVSLCDGAKDMAEGTGKFRAETSGMNEKLEKEIDDILNTIGGNMENPVSFVSEKNTNVSSVQFVIRTDSIQVEEAEEKEADTKEETTFVQKFINLFR